MPAKTNPESSQSASPRATAAMCFPKGRRILRRADFLQVQQGGRSVHMPHFVAAVVPGDASRLGITVTKKVANAVGRNRIRRVVREVYRKRADLFPAGASIVLIARREAQTLGYAQVEAELSAARAALARAGAKP